MAHQWHSQAELPYLQTLPNDYQRTGKMKWWDEFCWVLWACWPDAKPPATKLETAALQQQQTRGKTFLRLVKLRGHNWSADSQTILQRSFFTYFSLFSAASAGHLLIKPVLICVRMQGAFIQQDSCQGLMEGFPHLPIRQPSPFAIISVSVLCLIISILLHVIWAPSNEWPYHRGVCYTALPK